jgi:dolichol-phosphate mannosyltransferase
MKGFVVIPTYNEKENIEKLVKEIFALKINNLVVLIVDDNSPDQTGQIVENLKKNYSQLFLLKRSGKLGLGSAYKEGFRFALNEGADYVVEMDADFSHQPKYLPTIIDNLTEYDLVIGSRYLKNGGVENWPWWRKFLSAGANFYVEFFLNLDVKDATAGYRAYRKEIFTKIDLAKVVSDGYSFQVEMTYLTKRAGFKIKEVPIIFPDRSQGVSKINRQKIYRAIAAVWRLKFKNK